MRKISELLNDFHLTQQVEGKAVKYIDLCRYKLNRWYKYIREVYGIELIDDVKAAHIRGYIGHCQELGLEKNITINGNIATIRLFFKYLVEEGYLDEFENPARKIKDLREDKRIITTFTDEEVRRIITLIPERTYQNIRDKCMVAFLFDTGIRVSELCGIKNDDIRHNSILIRGKGSKERLVYISPIMRKLMRKFERAKAKKFDKPHFEEIEDYYFLDQSGMQLHRSRINRILKDRVKSANVRKEVRGCPHDCRHYFAQAQLRNGIDMYSLSRLLGHYDASMTSKYLRGMEQSDILKIGRTYSPLRNLSV
ncbi:tyrosine-type recombinase/integrase [Ureibacillus sp. FSL E2-3493]|uniref:tyrosine-type recombinase/integrase n=1 Tax=Ureibacillus sp. FSL E2-3493 TaxID=2921367 RepID=UPI00311980ED